MSSYLMLIVPALIDAEVIRFFSVVAKYIFLPFGIADAIAGKIHVTTTWDASFQIARVGICKYQLTEAYSYLVSINGKQAVCCITPIGGLVPFNRCPSASY
ncbi:hypothetical protein ACX0G9_15665 [Flavitalea flava]